MLSFKLMCFAFQPLVTETLYRPQNDLNVCETMNLMPSTENKWTLPYSNGKLGGRVNHLMGQWVGTCFIIERNHNRRYKLIHADFDQHPGPFREKRDIHTLSLKTKLRPHHLTRETRKTNTEMFIFLKILQVPQWTLFLRVSSGKELLAFGHLYEGP